MHAYTISLHEPDGREYLLTIWGRGTSCRLQHGDREVFWQGDEAAVITDRIDREGAEALVDIWAEYAPED